MNETTNSEVLADSEKPVQVSDNVQFPPLPEPTDDDFDEDISEDERTFYLTKFKDLNSITHMKIHCTACDRHLGLSPKNESRMKTHPLLRTLVCQTCQSFYNSGEFEKGDDGSELYCRWCGQGGQVYCCSACPHVFCAKCIKRNLGPAKIKEIEELDDWKCFKCNSTCLRDLRAICWAALRYCDLKNRITCKTEDAELKELYSQDCAQDHSECCKSKYRRKEKLEAKKRKETKEAEAKKSAASVISKIPATIQVKKFASINVEEVAKQETKKAQKRSASPKNKHILVKNPITVAQKIVNTFHVSPMKKVRLPPPSVLNPIRIMNDRKQVPNNNFIKIRPKNQFPVMYNGMNSSSPYTNMFSNDNINLSIESLTQGLDMSAMSNVAGSSQDELVCTPDFPMEPLCEMTEDNTDDDVQCITPVPTSAPKGPPPPRSVHLADVSPDNIIQMTENDVTVNAATGGLKFRVDPQTLSSNKMYRLPDGRIFAINSNPNMPGGYSATIVAVTETNQAKPAVTYAAKINRPSVSTPPPLKVMNRSQINPKNISRQRSSKSSRSGDTPIREADLSVPVEWYRYNLIDAIDALEYSLSRLHRLKKEATTSFLRTRTVQEMRKLHRSLENLLNTSSHRFKEIRENINKELKQYIAKKTAVTNSEDDDDVEILPDMNDAPICIDENSLDSFSNETQEVDLTEGGSEHNDSGEKSKDSVLETTVNDEHNMIAPIDLLNEEDKVKDDAEVNDDERLKMTKTADILCNESLDNIDKLNNSEDVEQNDDVIKRKKLNDNLEQTESKVTEEDNPHKAETQGENNDVNKVENDVEDSSQKCVEGNDSNKNQETHKDDSKLIPNGKSKNFDVSDDLLKDDGDGNRETSDTSTMEISDEIKET